MIISIHHYELEESVTHQEFLDVVGEAQQKNLFDLPGLVKYRFMRGIKGARDREIVALWIYESRSEWEKLWGPIDDPKPKSDYPDQWNRWEDDYLAPILSTGPDEIEFTSYEVLAVGDNSQ